ncbi:ADP compounds hydrolase NudE [Sinobacterium norvegicum]|uniref:ADP compounds hydrolase NudE n=1 Tax=Sinobacterium norvegicum TaxID=1641715 RepID=A0ABN8EKL6_9GAMM|nr:ADP compounds hydrolase NudE [Sinobacterium norvegicum]CAH0992896.1 ADP compounds hydrolase NudE [Sinobacterium norvegicum]
MSEQQPPKIIDQQWLTHSKLFHVEQLDLAFSNGEQRRYERLNPGRHAGVMVLPILDNHSLILIKEFGAGIDQYYLSFPKGAVDSGEDILDAGLRELQEEAGFAAKRLTPLKQISLSPSYMGNQMQYIVAEDLYPSALPGDEPEPLEVIHWPLSEIDQLALHPQFIESYGLAGLALLRAHLSAGKK